VDLFAEANKAVEAEEAAERAEEEEQEDANDEPEDDFNAAWEILDLARSLFDKRKDEDDEIKLKLADTYVSLGDVSLETGASRQCPIHGLG
jgi:HAT1-interacting factor 1